MIGKTRKNVGVCVLILIHIPILIVGLVELIYNPWWWHSIILISTYATPEFQLKQTFRRQNDWKKRKTQTTKLCASTFQSKTFNI